VNIIKLLIATCLVSTALCSAEPNQAPLHTALKMTNAAKKEAKAPKIDLKAIKKSEIPEVTPSFLANFFVPKSNYNSLFSYGSSTYTILPYAQEISYSYGDLYHIAYYSDVTVITTISGFDYGYQVILSPYGTTLSTQSIYYVDSTGLGTYLRHEYLDVTIVTGTDQVVYIK
jgi:hypothetical protein